MKLIVAMIVGLTVIVVDDMAKSLNAVLELCAGI